MCPEMYTFTVIVCQLVYFYTFKTIEITLKHIYVFIANLSLSVERYVVYNILNHLTTKNRL